MNVIQYRNDIDAAAKIIRSKFSENIEWLLILGSGLGRLADGIVDPVIVSYEELPGFPKSTVPGHEGRFILGSWSGKTVAVMQGRFHYYEGYDISETVLPIRVMQALGVKNLLLTNAAGGMAEGMKPGDLMLINDHISLWAESPLRGANLDEFGPRFIDQTSVYDPKFGSIIKNQAAELGITMHQGVYAWCRGPQFETPAEIRLLKFVGASAAGMSTVPEAITAAHGGMKTAAISCITNLAAGISKQKLSHEEVMETGAKAADATISLITAFLENV
ncbi:MAG: purine-nucleoside phosphorylase [Clostridiaceae bacterium]|nr:purine-nucleoside phosphorylase [Clostridiaceae bacterium]